jgi:cysteinyl-tRNA synthetase
MKLYNTLTKQKDELKPLTGNKFTVYACGPTVYDHAHIGNLRTYVNVDILRRALKYLGFEVEEVMNITDIEDKIIKAANEQDVDYREITKNYEETFLNDLEKLNIEKPEHMPHATEEIDGMIKIIEKLLETDFAYKSEDGSVYFSISKFKDYGKLAHLDFSGLKEGARVSQDEYDKENAQDFVLWKAKKDGEPSWPAPFGEGRPGWHIECSAMSMKYLGETVDIHAGAVDLIFPHHENEIAQSEAYTGKPFVKHWFHPEHLMINGKKMSKSLGNLYTIDEVCEKYNVEPLAFRMLCLQSNYRDKLNFTDDSILSAQNTLNNLRDFVIRMQQTSKEGEKTVVDKLIISSEEEFKKALKDDLNMPIALSVLFSFTREVNKYIAQGLTIQEAKEVLNLLFDFDKVLGLELAKVCATTGNEEVDKLLAERDIARADKDWVGADKLRDDIKKLGFDVEDTPNGQTLRRL